jgi:hypothetical protein
MSRKKAILGSNLGDPGGTQTPDALLRTEQNWVKNSILNLPTSLGVS